MAPFDFGKHVGKKGTTDLTDPLALFQALDRKTSHTTLRPAQDAALRELHARRTARDLVLKMPTGTGKSTVGLLHLRAKAAELKRAVVYLCPTVQLVRQVLEEAERLGVKAFHYASGESHPETACLSGEAVTVCTYDKLFNARTTFDRADVYITPAAIVLDDAHAGVEQVRDAFTATILDGGLLTSLHKILDGPARLYAAGHWDDLQSGRPGAPSLEIPYWSWRTVTADVRTTLTGRADSDELRFVWPHLRDILDWCRCIVAPNGIEIVSVVPPVNRVRAYREAAHRLFMSATLADDAVLVRELGCAPEAALQPLVPAAGTFGERLVLVPSLIDKSLNLEWVQKFCSRARTKWRVVVLCSSENQARRWEKFGARVVLGDDVSQAVQHLRSGQANFVVFANRYDGVDLPDDACRILVLDGLPAGQGIADRHDSAVRGAFQHRVAYRIEQGMGRAVRSNADYAVVLLAGPSLASFTAKPEVRAQMSADARAQIELAHVLPQLAQSDGAGQSAAATFLQMINQCLTRSPGWRSFYDERVRSVVASVQSSRDEPRVRLAAAERDAAERAQDGRAAEAAAILQGSLDTYLPRDRAKAEAPLARMRAYYLQQLASYHHENDPGKALELQHAAHEADQDLLRPAASRVRKLTAPTLGQPATLLKFYAGFDNPNAFLALLETIKPGLSFEADPHQFERSLKELAPYIGAGGTRPEHEQGEGPDDLYSWSTMNLVIEVKNERQLETIPKKDAEQLLHSIQWFGDNHPSLRNSVIPVMVARAVKPAKGVHLPPNTRIITPEKLDGFLAAVTKLALRIAQNPPAEWTVQAIAGLLSDHRLAPDRLLAAFTVKAK
jgi:hypothetical protein